MRFCKKGRPARSPLAGDAPSFAQPLCTDKPISYAPAREQPRCLATFPVGLALLRECLRTLDRILAVGHRHIGWIVHVTHGEFDCANVERALHHLFCGADAHGRTFEDLPSPAT